MTSANRESSEGVPSPSPDRLSVYPRRVRFAGHEWVIKRTTNKPVGPGPNHFSDDPADIWVDDAGMHFTVRQQADRWTCTEAILDAHLGHGRYLWETNTRIELLDPRLVAGFFTWDDHGDAGGPWPFREIDVEYTRWGRPEDPDVAQFTVQPHWPPGSLLRFPVATNPADPRLTARFDWLPDRIDFSLHAAGIDSWASAPALREWTYDGPNLQPPGRENPRVNLWLSGGNPPLGQRDWELVLSGFSHQPLPASP
jgi:hypothetical protein